MTQNDQSLLTDFVKTLELLEETNTAMLGTPPLLNFGGLKHLATAAIERGSKQTRAGEAKADQAGKRLAEDGMRGFKADHERGLLGGIGAFLEDSPEKVEMDRRMKRAGG